MMIECRIQRRFPVAVATLAGRLDHSGGVDAVVTLRGCLAEQPVQLVLDVAGLEVTDPTAVRLLVGLARDARRWPGTPVVVGGADGQVRELLGEVAEPGLLEVVGTVEQAVRMGSGLPVPPRMDVELAPDAQAPAAGREVVARACRQWGLGRWQRLAQLLVSELVMNAVVHARTRIAVTVRQLDGVLQVAVRDGDPRLVDRPPTGPDQLPVGDPGRGFLLLESLADDWGCAQTSDGKVMWADVALVPARPAPSDPLP